MSKTIESNSDITDKKNDASLSYSFDVIAKVDSPYKEKFAIPRQPNLVSAAKGKIIFADKNNNSDLIRGIEQFTHLWIIFVFHGTQDQGWKPLVRPPRLGGNEKTGVLATRSTFRPNPIGMSVVKLDSVTVENKKTVLHISGLDLLHNTPVLDIKPYIPYSDAIHSAEAGYAQDQPDTKIVIEFSHQAENDLAQYQQEYSELALLVEQILKQDPRPAYKAAKPDNKVYGMSIYDLNIQFTFTNVNTIQVVNMTRNTQK